MLATLPWDLAPDLPWRVLTSPAEKWQAQPSFVVGEVVFILLAVAALVHARSHGRAHVLAWVGALVAGTANDVIFMALPLVDNFWQAQAMIMLAPRLPLYIPCVYVCFMYLPTVAVWRLRLPPLSRAALTGLAAIAVYAPYDIVGAKFLWWTWHDTDPPIASRLLGVPIGSTMWVITFAATFAWLLGRVVDRDPEVSGRTFARGVAVVAAFSSVLMVLQMTVLQQIDGGTPGPVGLVVLVVLYGALAVRGLRRAAPRPATRADRRLAAAVAAYFAALALVMAAFDPATHRSESLHQPYGACHVEQTDITGQTRYAFLCAEDFDEDFTFDCVEAPPAPGTKWYTVCGRPHTNRPLWLGVAAALALLGAVLYAGLLGGAWRGSDPT